MSQPAATVAEWRDRIQHVLEGPECGACDGTGSRYDRTMASRRSVCPTCTGSGKLGIHENAARGEADRITAEVVVPLLARIVAALAVLDTVPKPPPVHVHTDACHIDRADCLATVVRKALEGDRDE